MLQILGFSLLATVALVFILNCNTGSPRHINQVIPLEYKIYIPRWTQMASQIKKFTSANVYRLLKNKYLAMSYLLTGVSMIEKAYVKVESHCGFL